jgi:hypothetical protein
MGSHVSTDSFMITVIQGAAGRQPHAGHMKTRDGRRVLFVADPEQAPGEPGVCHARPDASSSFCVTWRKLVLGYNENPRDNPLGLLPAYQLYPDAIYARLVEELGSYRTRILSAGWGLIKASFLTPNYDITLNPEAEPFRRRKPGDAWADLCMLPAGSDEDLYFFGDEDHVPLFARLTAAYPGRRIVFYHSANPPEAPGCTLRKFESGDGENGYHQCALAFLADRPKPRKEAAPRKVSHLESRMRQTMGKFKSTSALLADDAFEPDDAVIRAAIGNARNEIAEYLWLMRSLRELNVSEDADFQQRFNAFHGISQRSQAWHTAFYWLLETAKAIGADFADILYTLWDRTGRYEPGFASRLVATVDPSKPTWDRFALMNSGLRAPGYPDPQKLEKAVGVYRGICDWYATRLASPGGRRILELFDEEVPDHEAISALKKFEWVLRYARTGSRVIPAVGRTAASLSHQV